MEPEADVVDVKARYSKKASALPVLLFAIFSPAHFSLQGLAQEGAPGEGFSAFRHSTHVPSEWTDEEFRRDCRGCHDYDNQKAGAEQAALRDICANCHVHGTRVARLTGEWKSSSPVHGGEALFHHRDHLKMDCKPCHWNPPQGNQPRDDVPDHFVVPAVSMSYCSGCHDPAKRKTTKDEHARFIDGLNRKLQGRHARGQALRPFSHIDHLGAADIEGEKHEKCTVCHVDLSSADARNLGEKQFSTKPCGKCHSGEFAVEIYEKVSPTAATFLHRYHLRDRALQADGELNQQRCFKCHEHPVRNGKVVAGEEDRFRLKDLFRVKAAQGKGPSSCLGCHQHAEWGVTEHGQVAKCAYCHEIADGFTDMARLAKNRPRVEVKRPRVTGFAASVQAHPFITEKKDEDHNAGAAKEPKKGKIEEDCKGCHIANLSELPSRLRNREFRHTTHTTHVSAKLAPEAKDCEKCHTEVKLTSSPADIKAQTLPSGVALHYDPKVCDSCHKGRELKANFDPGETRKVFLFSHLDHLKSKPPGFDRIANCLDCHVLNEGGADIVGDELPPKVADCTLCHNHKDHPEITGEISFSELERCNRCHAIGVPMRGQPVFMQRLRLRSASGAQVHATTTACEDCHQPREVPGERPRTGPTVAGSTRKIVPHSLHSRNLAGAQWVSCVDCRAGQNDPHQADWNFTDAAHCIDCHWFRLKQSFILAGEPYANKRPSEIRAEYGSRKEGKNHPFPGIPPRK